MSGEIQDNDLVQAFRDQITFINNACEKLEQGNVPDLSAIEKDMERLCEQAKGTDPETAHALCGLMAEMINDLENLARRIKEHHDRR